MAKVFGKQPKIIGSTPVIIRNNKSLIAIKTHNDRRENS
jgi:hypothetical protein